MKKPSRAEILEYYEHGDFTFELAMQAIVNNGDCPALLFDDNGHWAISDVGFENIDGLWYDYDIEPDSWKDSIREALIYYLSK